MKQMLRRLVARVTLADFDYKFLFDPPPENEVVSLDCETTGLNPRTDEIVSVAAVRIRGNRILTSERFEALVRPDASPSAESIKVHHIRAKDVEGAEPMWRVISSLLHFIGSRPIVGYYIDFDIRMLDKYVLRYIEARLPNRRIEVSELYYDLKYKNSHMTTLYDLSFASILKELGIPPLAQHSALNDAVMAAMIYLHLEDLRRRGGSLRQRATETSFLPAGG